MNEIIVLKDELHYAISVDEVLWGALLMAITMVIHGSGMVSTVRVCNGLNQRIQRLEKRTYVLGLGVLIIAAWMIIVIDLAETAVWAGFYVLTGAMNSFSRAYYYALVNFCTLDSGYLPLRWRLLEGMLGLAGWLTLAWSTGVLFTLAQQFQERHVGSWSRARDVAADRRTVAGHQRAKTLDRGEG
jgi:hypothetical protein